MNVVFDQFDELMATGLVSVNMWAHPDLPNGVGLIELVFQTGQVFIGIEVEFDTLRCSRMTSESNEVYSWPILSPFWHPILGMTLVGAWRMTNDRGYPDGIQLHFRDRANAGAVRIVQLFGEASQITLSHLYEGRRESMSKVTQM